MNKYSLLGLMLILSACSSMFNNTTVLPKLSHIQAGDIVIISADGLESVFLTLALGSKKKNAVDEKVSYSHAEMVFRDDEGDLQLGGVFGGEVNAGKLSERLQKFKHFSVYRALAPLQKRQKAAELLKQWINDPVISTAKFDYNFSYQAGRTDKFFCAGIVNEAYRVADIELPFVNIQWTANQFSQHFEKILGKKLQNVLDVNSINDSKHYQQIVNGGDSNLAQEKTQKLKDMSLYLLAQYELGWKLKLSNKQHLGLMLLDLPIGIERLSYLRISFRLFHNDVFATWERLKRRGQLDELDLSEKNNLFHRIMDKYREKYFVFSGIAAAASS